MQTRVTMVAVFLTGGMAAAGIVHYDVATDWSDTQNPNGAWLYNMGDTPLPNNLPWGSVGTSQNWWSWQDRGP